MNVTSLECKQSSVNEGTLKLSHNTAVPQNGMKSMQTISLAVQLQGKSKYVHSSRWLVPKGSRGEGLKAAGPMQPHWWLNRSPAEGSGARPPVTLGSSVKSGRFCRCDLSSSRT